MKSLNRRLFMTVYLIMYQVYAGVAEDDIGNANNYVDEVLQNLRDTPSMVSQIDPLNIPDFDEGKFKGSDGVIQGLSSLYRKGDCTIEYKDGVATVTGEVAVRDVNLSLKYKAKALFFWINGHVEMIVEHLAVKLVLSAQNGRATLESFKVTDLGNYKIKKITGISVVLNWLLKLIANSVAKKSRGKIIDALENGAAGALNDLLAKQDIPLLMF